MTVEKSIERTRNAFSSRHAYEFVIFHDRFSSKRLACFEKTHSTKLVQISLPVHLNGTCTCGPSGPLDLHCSANAVQYRGMALLRATRQLKMAEFLEHTYVIVMDAEAHVLGGDPFSELLDAEAGFAFYAWGAVNDRSWMGGIREWAIGLVRAWGVDARLFELSYGTMAPECILCNLNVPAVCCGVRVSSFSGDVVAFRTDVMRTKPVQRMLRAWEDTSMLRDNRSTEQEMWRNWFGLLIPPAAIHQFSDRAARASWLHARRGTVVFTRATHEIASPFVTAATFHLASPLSISCLFRAITASAAIRVSNADPLVNDAHVIRNHALSVWSARADLRSFHRQCDDARESVCSECRPNSLRRSE